jgi:hypothetical protein
MRKDGLTALNTFRLVCDVVCSGYTCTGISEEISAAMLMVDFLINKTQKSILQIKFSGALTNPIEPSPSGQAISR